MSQLIAIEGIDGSGKGTQAALLRDRFVRAGRRGALLSFPQYQHTFFGQRIGEYLNGHFGGLDDVHPFFVSLLYAGDRLESKPVLLQALQENDVVILDRYVASNIAHQCAKLPSAEQSQLAAWIEEIEFGLHGLPRPDLTICFDLTVPRAQQLILRKASRSYTTLSADLQEADSHYLEQVRKCYLDLANCRSDWRMVQVEGAQGLREIAEIAEDVYAICTSAGPASSSSTG